MDRTINGELPLAGVTVVDFTQAFAGPVAAQVLCDFGARVIKVERYPDGDIMRSGWGHAVGGFFLPFAVINRGKESICLDARHPRGREILDKLLSRADILMHNFRPGVMERMGLGYAAVQERYPHLIYAEATGFGSVGPWAEKGGQDLLAQALGGLMWQNSADGRRPQVVGMALADYSSGMGLLTGILMALLQRHRTGRGCRVESSLLEGVMFPITQEIAEAQIGHRLAQGMDPTTGIFAAQDGFLVVMPIWRADALKIFLEVLGLGEYLGHPHMRDTDTRQAHYAWVKDLLESSMRQQPVSYWMERLEERGILCAPVSRLEDLAVHEQVQAVQPFVEMRRSDGAPIGKAVRPQMHVGGRTGAQAVVPAVGEHSARLLRELGYSETDIAALGAEKAVLVP